ncbi:MAG: acyl-CoA dehydrogenase family protein, partial [Anaerolineales bacterium]|nr:acyl-CoA dehydrogenase family protein [Anaerolineales bacterium]
MNFDLNEEQRMWQEVVHDFVSREVKSRASHVDEAEEFNQVAASKMGPIGLLGLYVEEEYGGTGVDAISAAIAIEELGWGCGSTALALAAHNGLGCAPITMFGNSEQKQRFLPEVTGAKPG